MSNIGERIKHFAGMQFGGLSKFCQHSGLGITHISRYATNKIEPGASNLAKFAQYGCDINWLLLGDEMPEVIFPEKAPERVYNTGFKELVVSEPKNAYLADTKQVENLEKDIRYFQMRIIYLEHLLRENKIDFKSL